MGFLSDNELGEINTPHGKVKFLQLIGLTQKEYESVRDDKLDFAEIFEKLRLGNPLLVTDIDRGEI